MLYEVITNFSIWPNQQYSPDGQPTGTRYVVDNSVFVTVRKLDELGDLLDSAVAAGANSINSIQFDVSDKTEALKKAREEAVKDAKAQAQELVITSYSIHYTKLYDQVEVEPPLRAL